MNVLCPNFKKKKKDEVLTTILKRNFMQNCLDKVKNSKNPYENKKNPTTIFTFLQKKPPRFENFCN